jgi:hypothetical protein
VSLNNRTLEIMKKFFIFIILFVLVLTSCGTGGSRKPAAKLGTSMEKT